MAPKLSEVLISEGLITSEQLQEALKCQVKFGRSLGATLVEMDMIKDSDVLRCLSKQLERPFVSPEQLTSVTPEIIALIPNEIAELYEIVPVSLEKKTLTVAMSDPSDLAAIAKISFITGYTIVPAVTSELRVFHALEQYYGITREQAVPSDPATLEDVISPGGVERNESSAPVVKPQAQEACRDWESELISALWPYQSDNDPGSPNIPLDDTEIPVLEEPTPQIIAPAKPSPLPAEMASPPTAAVHLDQMEPLSPELRGSVLTEARGRDRIAGSVADYVYQNAERVALFMVKGRMAAGWKAHLRKKEVEGFENFRLTLDEPSAIKAVADTRSFYLGPILDTAGNQKLLAALGGGAPQRALLVPLMIMRRVVMIFYLDGGKDLAKDLENLLNTADMADLAFEILHFLSSSDSSL